jgi:hypothetical protein
MSIAKNLAGICIVRNAQDLIGLACGHYLRIGLAHIKFIDDGSTDGTYELLTRLSRQEKRISVARVNHTVFRQAELMSEGATELIRRGFSIILPFDADEFWNVSGPDLERRYAPSSEIAFFGQWINFVHRETATMRRYYLLGVKHSAPVLADSNEATITTYRRPFVCATEAKVAFKARRPVELNKGQHALVAGPSERDPTDYEIFHLPLRNKNEIIKRGLDREPRTAPLRDSPSLGWQSRFHREAVLADRADEVWRANSADKDGFLNCNDERIALKRDRRLQMILAKSYAYVALRYRILLP